MNGSPQDVKEDFQRGTIQARDIQPVRQGLANIKYGPTEIPIYNFLLQLTVLNPAGRDRYISIIRYLALEAFVPVDSTDKSGTTALAWSISTKPYLDTSVADIFIQSGAKINARNRYGCVAGHEIIMVSNADERSVKKITTALRYFSEKGGDIHIADGDDMIVKWISDAASKLIPALTPLLGVPVVGKGFSQTPSESIQPAKKIGRNELCGCGSMKKYKACCGKIEVVLSSVQHHRSLTLVNSTLSPARILKHWTLSGKSVGYTNPRIPSAYLSRCKHSSRIILPERSSTQQWIPRISPKLLISNGQ